MIFGLPDKTLTEIQQLLSQFPEVESAIIYGSRVKGNFKNGSDVDLVLSGQNLSFELLTKIGSKIDDLSTPYLFDLSILSMIENQQLLDHINRAGKTLFHR
ncbi:MAG: nucleotidyltransferase domain-containing protein [Bacteroidota bacterium]|jgi:predicted nucleotidyltransferase|nr:nucleotidyltransferase domain-containing protein [Cytophagales bacterium]MCE2957641.1 nucleotidyltransferase domain-containing protein [Flammeovirgaceae bacterium]MCZ8070992.1 nucleotidyltransferase domain-containing protein [Cytophagales bacterium]